VGKAGKAIATGIFGRNENKTGSSDSVQGTKLVFTGSNTSLSPAPFEPLRNEAAQSFMLQ
jgi:hypothetical protein